MAYMVVDLQAEYADVSTGIRQVRAVLIADTASDLPSSTTDLIWLLGSSAKVVDDGSEYYINSNGVWVQQPSSNQLDLTGYYTSAETDTLLAGKQDSLTSAQIDAINTAVNGSKNKLDYTLASLQSLNTAGTWSSNVYTRRGISFTVNSDMTITVTGTNDGTGNSWLDLKGSNTYSGMYGTGCPSGGSDSTYRIQFGNDRYDSGSGAITNTGSVGIVVYTGTTVNDLIFRPMISDSLTNDYEPYCPSIYELYQLIMSN